MFAFTYSGLREGSLCAPFDLHRLTYRSSSWFFHYSASNFYSLPCILLNVFPRVYLYAPCQQIAAPCFPCWIHTQTEAQDNRVAANSRDIHCVNVISATPACLESWLSQQYRANVIFTLRVPPQPARGGRERQVGVRTVALSPTLTTASHQTPPSCPAVPSRAAT